VSGSSGRLVVERLKGSDKAPTWPGLVFSDPERDYEEAMQAYLAATQERLLQLKGEKAIHPGRKAEKQALRREAEALREERYQIRERRKQEDLAWRALRKQFKAEWNAYQALSKPERRQQRQVRENWKQRWQTAWEQRRARLQVREPEDQAWHTRREQIRERTIGAPNLATWLAILVVTDNCTRQCLGLPLFVSGANVTSEMVVQALEVLLPDELKYVISDQGSHFRTRVFADLAERQDFIWVPIARHRPQSNGIAERFVRTLKEWLADQAWQSSQELVALLAMFLPHYNHRPHQGLPIPGLSPNEFAKRIWLM
jgi:transposase InsO family protein